MAFLVIRWKEYLTSSFRPKDATDPWLGWKEENDCLEKISGSVILRPTLTNPRPVYKKYLLEMQLKVEKERR